MEMSVLTTIRLTVVACCKCGIEFGITTPFHSQRTQDHATFFCPSGHQLHYPQQNATERAEQAAKRAHELLAQERLKVAEKERQLAAAKGQMTKIVNRVQKGICPCCNRSFANLRRHMATQHPDTDRATT